MRHGPAPADGTAPPGGTLTAGPGELHVWVLRRPWTGDEPPPMVTDELDEHERERAETFVRPQDRLLYLSAHIAMRRVLSLYLGVTPAEVVFGRAPCPCCGALHGRPVVRGAVSPPHFSLSHSQGVAVIGVATVPVGIDVQRVPTAETTELCLQDLHSWEQRDLTGLPSEERPMGFARLWTRKEAFLKGLGAGLGRDLAADYLGDAEGDEVPDGPAGWLVGNLPSDAGFATAVALLTGDGHLATLRVVPSDCLYVEDATDLIAGAEPAGELAMIARHKGNGERHAEHDRIARTF